MYLTEVGLHSRFRVSVDESVEVKHAHHLVMRTENGMKLYVH